MDKKEFFKQEASKNVFTEKYMFRGEEDIYEVFDEVSGEIASVETTTSDQKFWKDSFYRELTSGRLIPAGRIIANARTGEFINKLKEQFPDKKITHLKNYNNCFTIGIDDSMEDIYTSIKEHALISKEGGGVGINFSEIRPKGDALSVGGIASGVLSFMDVINQSSKVIMTGGQRRAANIALLHVSHPEIRDFITAKHGEENGRLTMFNISVIVTDAFIDAVEADGDWNLEFGGKVYETIKARELYDLIAKNAFIHNEPGIFCQDTVERYNNAHGDLVLDRVNPCGELVMPAYSLCCLAAVNLTQFVVNPFREDAYFDYFRFGVTIGVGVRFLDNVLDATNYPLDKIEELSKQWRRIGLGFTGLANAMAMMRIRYGSEKSKDFMGSIAKNLRDYTYQGSIEVAKEKGPFPAFDADKFLSANFVQKLPSDIQDDIRKYGIRNIQMNTVAPTGTISFSVGNYCSSGIEPVFTYGGVRNVTNEDLSMRQVYVRDYGMTLYREMLGLKDDEELKEIPDYFVLAHEVEPKDSIEIQAICQEYIDHSISKTLNLKPGTTYEEYKDLFLLAYKKGLKGFTTFNPEGSMAGILTTEQELKDEGVENAPSLSKRPDKIPCDVHDVTHNKRSFKIIIGLVDKRPYEIFFIENFYESMEIEGYVLTKSYVEKVTFEDETPNRYDLVGYYCPANDTGCTTPIVIRTIDIGRKHTVNGSIARLVSMALRYQAPVQFVVKQLQKDTNFGDFEKTVSRILKLYINDGEKVVSEGTGKALTCEKCGVELIMQEGCVLCPNCGWSKCG